MNGFIEEIKQNPQDWKIEEEDNAIHDKVSWGGCFVVKHKSGRKHYRPFPLGYKKGHNLFASFSPEEWTEIENALNYQKQTDLEQLDSYENWTKEQLISEINRLKDENEELKNNQTLTSSERQERLQKNQEKLEKFQSFLDKDALQPVNNNSFAPFLISGAVLAVVIGLVSFLVIKNLRKSKKD